MRNVLSILSSTALVALTAQGAGAQPAPAPAPSPTTPPVEPAPAPAPTGEPAPTLAAPPEAPADAPPPEPPAAAPTDAPPKRLAVGKEGLFQPGLLMQGWFLVNHAGDTSSTFRLRRAEISAKGEIVPKKVGYAVMFDPAKVREFNTVTVTGPMGDVTIRQPTTAVSVLQDFYITYLSSYADVSLGQFKIPVSWEGYNSSSKLLFPERALISSKFGDARDLGVRITKTFKRWGYSAGIFNGEGLNRLDTNNQKDVALRLEVYPVEGLTLAAVTYDSLGERDLAGTKDRWEADVRYERGPLLVQAELIRGRDVPATGDAIQGQGVYVAGGYTLPGAVLGGSLQPVARIGYLDTNVDADDDQVLHYDVGVNYYLRAHEMKLQASYSRQQFEDDAANQFILAAQVAY